MKHMTRTVTRLTMGTNKTKRNNNEEWLDDKALFDGDEDMEDIDDDDDV